MNDCQWQHYEALDLSTWIGKNHYKKKNVWGDGLCFFRVFYNVLEDNQLTNEWLTINNFVIKCAKISFQRLSNEAGQKQVCYHLSNYVR